MARWASWEIAQTARVVARERASEVCTSISRAMLATESWDEVAGGIGGHLEGAIAAGSQALPKSPAPAFRTLGRKEAGI